MALFSPRDVLHVPVVNVSASSDLVAAPGAGRQIVVLGYMLTSDGNGEVTWRSGTTAMSGAMEIIADTPLSDRDPDLGVLRCAANQALNLLPVTAVVNGYVRYAVLPAIG
jgi:hypothetical protein